MNKKPQVLIETIPFQIESITEEGPEGGKKFMRLRGVCQIADERNGNGRIYPLPLIEREVRALNERTAKQDTVYSAVDHPADGRNLIANTGGIVTSASIDPGTKRVVAEFKVIPTAKGKDLQAVLRAGGKVGISARGYGSVMPGEVNGIKGDVVQEDYKLSTWDFVISASHEDAQVTDVLEQQARQGQEEEMDKLKELKLDELTAARPDLIQAITDAAVLKVKTETLASVEGLVTAKTAEIEKNIRERLEKEYKEKLEAYGAADKKKKKDQEDADEDMDEAVKSLAAKKGITVQEAAERIAKRGGLTLVVADHQHESQELTTVKRELTESQNAIRVLNTTLTELTADRGAVLIAKRIDEVTKEEPFKAALRQKLIESCKTVEDVDRLLPSEKKYIESIIGAGAAGAGKGHASHLEESGSGRTQEEEGKTVKTQSGLMITESQARIRRFANLEN